MRTLAPLVLLACPVAFASAAEPNLDGEWKIERRTFDRESRQICTFSQKANVLGGSCNSRSGPVKLTGKVEGQKVNWTVKTESEGGPVTIIYKGAIDSPNTMSGTVSALEFGVSGEFKAMRSK